MTDLMPKLSKFCIWALVGCDAKAACSVTLTMAASGGGGKLLSILLASKAILYNFPGLDFSKQLIYLNRLCNFR